MPTVQRPKRLTSQEWDTEDDRQFRDNVSSIRASLEEIAGFATTVKKWTPWVVAFIGVAYPTIGKLINQLPPIPH